MTEEECLLAQLELRKRGYRYFYAFHSGNGRYSLRARCYAPHTGRGMIEQPIVLTKPEDLARHLG